MSKLYDAIIIGGGASGTAAAVTALKRGRDVLILERAPTLCKKLLATGNGKCNLSNVKISGENFNTELVDAFLKKADVNDLFAYVGIRTREIEGRIYPYSESAMTVADAIRLHIPIECICYEEAVKLEREKDGTYVVNGKYRAKKIAICSGSNATSGRNSHGLAINFGHTCNELKPSLVPLVTDTRAIVGLSGLRAKVKMSLVSRGKTAYEKSGELLFKENGLSGIVSMELSSYIARNGGTYDVKIDFAPDMAESEIEDFLKRSTLIGLLHKTIAGAVERQGKEEKRSLASVVKGFYVKNAKNAGNEQAQVMCGGLNLNEFDENLESKISKGLYACGEVLDVDGDCGGYNLHWAFLSGMIVGERL